MKKFKKWLLDVFDSQHYENLDISQISEALSSQEVRARWLDDCLDELKRIHGEVDKRLLNGSDYGLTDLCARRKAFQDILQGVLSARRSVATQSERHNPRPKVDVNLDRVTA